MMLKSYLKKRKEKKAFRKIIAPKIEAAERKAYAEESIKQAKMKGKAKARGGNFARKALEFNNNAVIKGRKIAKSYSKGKGKKKKKRYYKKPARKQVPALRIDDLF